MQKRGVEGEEEMGVGGEMSALQSEVKFTPAARV